MTISPIAIGMFVVLEGENFNESQNRDMDGKKYPDRTPMAMAENIHKVRLRSKKLSLLFEGIFFNLKI